LKSERFVTPLRFPGGKRKLFAFFRDLIAHNGLRGAHYVEPFAGGAGLALSLLVSGCVKCIHLNDIDVATSTFWRIALEEPEELCRRIEAIPVDMATWKRQREVIQNPARYADIDVALATLFLNRTNRSGILQAGPIGGLDQAGRWKINARFNKNEIVRRIRLIAAFREKIRVYNQDAVQFLEHLPQWIPQTEKTLVYADPPYYGKGRRLYHHFYQPDDHRRLAQVIKRLPYPWVVSYDDVDEVYVLYPNVPHLRYWLHYTAQVRGRGQEVMFFHDLEIPHIEQGEFWRPMRVD